MSHCGTGLIAIMAFVVFAAAGHLTLSSHTTTGVAKGAVPEFSDEHRQLDLGSSRLESGESSTMHA
jgi:hypothetical protein